MFESKEVLMLFSFLKGGRQQGLPPTPLIFIGLIREWGSLTASSLKPPGKEQPTGSSHGQSFYRTEKDTVLKRNLYLDCGLWAELLEIVKFHHFRHYEPFLKIRVNFAGCLRCFSSFLSKTSRKNLKHQIKTLDFRHKQILDNKSYASKKL